MTKRLLSAMLISAALPGAALAQTATTPPATPDAAMTNQNNAHGGINDARPMGQSIPTASTTNPFVTVPASGVWRVSDLEGKPVYGSDGNSIGDINDVLVSQNGSVNAVVIGVGGFLGIGEKDVAVNMSALQLGPGATQADANAAAEKPAPVSGETTASTNNGAKMAAKPPATGTSAATNMPPVSTGNAATGTAADNTQMAANNAGKIEIGDDGLPDRIILNVNRQQLQDAPAFQGVTEQR